MDLDPISSFLDPQNPFPIFPACGAVHGGRHGAGPAVELRRLGKALEDDDLGRFRGDFHVDPVGSMYGIYANIGGILMVNVTIYSIHGSYGD